MALTKEQRDKLTADDFAFPRTRQCPIHDESHVSMAWKEVDRTQGVTDEERHEARKRILARAHKLGMDTSGWSTMKAMAIEAMSLEVPEGDHPNKMPFSGILVPLDRPSDLAPHGSGGRRVIMTTEAAKKAIPTLLGMGVNYTIKLDGHDPKKKIGIISDANVTDAGLHIEGFIYAFDFPDAAARIRADKKKLGFSFEAQDLKLADPGAAILTIEDCVFTGAAILLKEKAAFTTTSLAAQAEGQPQETEMTKEEIAAAVAEAMGTALKPLGDRLTAIEAAAKEAPAIQAKAHTEALIEPHAKALEACADGMEAAGIGGHPTRGHVHIARNMAKHLRASAALGQTPHIFRDPEFMMASSGDKTEIGDLIKAEVEKVTQPLKNELASEQTKVKDLQAAAATKSPAPERKTESPLATALLAKGEKPNDDGKFTVAQVDALLDAQGLKGPARIEAKMKLQASGQLIAA